MIACSIKTVRFFIKFQEKNEIIIQKTQSKKLSIANTGVNRLIDKPHHASSTGI